MSSDEIKAELELNEAALEAMLDCRACWEMGDSDRYNTLCAETMKLRKEYNAAREAEIAESSL